MDVLALALVMILLPVQASGEIPDSPKEMLRSHLHGELSFGREVRFDRPPLRDIGAKGDLVRMLIELLEEEGTTRQRLNEGMGAMSLLSQYWVQSPDARIPESLRRYSIDPARPLELRQEAAQRRGRLPAPGTPAFYAEILGGYPDLAGPLVAWLRATPGGLPGWMPFQELYTTEVRAALRVYIDGRLRIPGLAAEDREMYARLISDLDKAAAPSGSAPQSLPGVRPAGSDPAPKPPVAPPDHPDRAVPPDAPAENRLRPLLLVSLLGVAAAVVLLLTVRKKT